MCLGGTVWWIWRRTSLHNKVRKYRTYRIYLSIDPSMHLSIGPSIHPFIDPFIDLSIHLSIYLSTYLSISLSLYLCV